MQLKSLSLSIILSLVAAPAFAETWSLDSAHSAAQFKVKHMMVSNVNGSITGVKGTCEFDGKDVQSLKVDAQLDPTTINTNEPNRDKHLKGADFFDVAKYPTMEFKSKKVVRGTDGKFKLVGELTMHGVTKEVALNVEGPTPVIKDNQGNERVGASASATVNRKDFGMSFDKTLDNGGAVVGDQVDISLDIEMKKQKAASAETVKKAG